MLYQIIFVLKDYFDNYNYKVYFWVRKGKKVFYFLFFYQVRIRVGGGWWEGCFDLDFYCLIFVVFFVLFGD